MLLCLKKFPIKFKLFTVVASLNVFKVKLKSSLEKNIRNGQKKKYTHLLITLMEIGHC